MDILLLLSVVRLSISYFVIVAAKAIAAKLKLLHDNINSTLLFSEYKLNKCLIC